MPSHIILAVALTGALLGAPLMLAPVERASTSADECIGKKRVLSGTARAKRVEVRRRCHVIVPILM